MMVITTRGMASTRPRAGRLLPLADIDGTRHAGALHGEAAPGGHRFGELTPRSGLAPMPRKRTPKGRGSILERSSQTGRFACFHSGAQWRLYPLQGSFPFQAELRLPALGAKGQRVTSVEGLDQAGKPLGAVAFTHKGDVLHLDLDAAAFSYRIVLR